MIRVATIVLSVALAASAAVAFADGHYFVDLSALSGYQTANPCSVNSSGEVTGIYLASPATDHLFLYTGATTGTMNDLTSDFITSGGLISSAINDSGQLAVNRTISGWLYSGGLGGTATLLPGTETSATDINSQGVIGGDQLSGSIRAPIIYTGGTVYPLNSPFAGITATIMAINSSGQAVGYNKNTPVKNGALMPEGMFATVWTYTISGGSVASQSATDISSYLSAALSDNEASQAYAINGSGQVVGDWSTTYGANQSQMTGSFLYNTSTHAVASLPLNFVTQLGLGYLYDGQGENGLINDTGQVVGQITVDGVAHAAVWSAAGGLQDLNTLDADNLPAGFVLNNATAIDDNGDIVGYGTDSAGHTDQAFLLRAALPGDANLDGHVDINDLTIVLTNYGQTIDMSWTTGNFTGDGTVDINDLTIVLANYGQSEGASAAGLAAVPEPGMLALLAAGVVGLLILRRSPCSRS